MPTTSASTVVPPTTSAEVRDRAEALLRDLAGADAELRNDQFAAIDALVTDTTRVLLVQRTGWGKSAVYWISTALRRAQGHGPTLVVSPLLALMRDQVAAARRLGLRAETINSTNADDWDAVLAQLDADTVDVLLVSPERLNAMGFRDRLADLAPRLGLLVVDEAHCVSDWGHDFRPDYRRIADLLRDLGGAVPVLACTATANERVTEDVARQLSAGTDIPATTLRGALGRESLRLAVVGLPSAEARLGWLTKFVGQHRPVHGRAGIIYTLTVEDTRRVSGFLADRGLRVQPYSSALSAAERLATEDALLANELDAVVSTSALGMGYDKPDLAFVVHLGAPSSPVSWYQQVGRAGRAIDDADVVLLPTAKDRAIWHHFDLAGIPRPDEAASVLAALPSDGSPVSTPALEQAVNLRRTRLELLLKVLDVDGAVERVRGGWRATGQPWAHDAVRYDRLADLRREEHAAMARFVDGRVEGCLMQALVATLDDPRPEPCGRCQGCVGWEPDVVVDDATVADAREFLRGRDTPVPPRRRWPTGLGTVAGEQVKGNIGRDRQASEGRALASGDDSGWGGAVELVLAADEPTASAAFSEVVDGIVGVLARWDWQRRPSCVVPVPGGEHAELTLAVAEHVGTLGRLSVVHALARDADAAARQQRMRNSAHQAGNALEAIGLTDAARDLPRGPVLLVDSVRDSGWTLTAAAWRLTSTDAGPVLPLVLRG